MDAVLDSRRSRGASRDAPRAQGRRSVIVRGTRACAGGERSEVAKPVDSGLEEDWWWLPPESTDPGTHRTCGFRHRAARDRIYERTQAHDISLRGMRIEASGR